MNAIFVVKEGSLLVVSDRSLEHLSSEPVSYCDYNISEGKKSVNTFFVLFSLIFNITYSFSYLIMTYHK